MNNIYYDFFFFFSLGFLQLLSQLTEVGNITKDQFLSEFAIYIIIILAIYLIIATFINCSCRSFPQHEKFCRILRYSSGRFELWKSNRQRNSRR